MQAIIEGGDLISGGWWTRHCSKRVLLLLLLPHIQIETINHRAFYETLCKFIMGSAIFMKIIDDYSQK